jgi:hypothetical protein
LPKSSALFVDGNPTVVTWGYQTGSIPVAAATSGHPVTIRLVFLVYQSASVALVGLLSRGRPSRPGMRIAGIIRQLGDIVFFANDVEARQWGWTIERRHGGLGRRYRDPLFDTVATCLHCRGLGVAAADSWCVKCSGTGRVMIGQPPDVGQPLFPHDG